MTDDVVKKFLFVRGVSYQELYEGYLYDIPHRYYESAEGVCVFFDDVVGKKKFEAKLIKRNEE